MRQTITRAELHSRFSAALAAHPAGGTGAFVFEIDSKEPGSDGCNWYPLAAIQHWAGDLQANLSAFREVRESLSRDFNVEERVGDASGTA